MEYILTFFWREFVAPAAKKGPSHRLEPVSFGYMDVITFFQRPNGKYLSDTHLSVLDN